MHNAGIHTVRELFVVYTLRDYRQGGSAQPGEVKIGVRGDLEIVFQVNGSSKPRSYELKDINGLYLRAWNITVHYLALLSHFVCAWTVLHIVMTWSLYILTVIREIPRVETEDCSMFEQYFYTAILYILTLWYSLYYASSEEMLKIHVRFCHVHPCVEPFSAFLDREDHACWFTSM